MPRPIVVAIVVVAVLALNGCAAVGLMLVSVGASSAGGAGLGYTLDSIVYKTFTVPFDGLHAAVLMTFSRMDVTLKDDKAVDDGQKIVGTAGDRTIEIQLDRLTQNTTRMRTVAKKNWFVRDRATATEVILQTDRTLTDNPRLAALRHATRVNHVPATSK